MIDREHGERYRIGAFLRPARGESGKKRHFPERRRASSERLPVLNLAKIAAKTFRVPRAAALARLAAIARSLYRFRVV